VFVSIEIESLHERGAQSLEEERFDEALESLSEAHRMDPENARVQSLLGVAMARSGSSFETARSLCEEATKREFDNAELYVNLARVYLGYGRRREALRYLRRGQMIEPDHPAVLHAFVELGSRRPPVCRFLPRRHPLNRLLGTLRSRFFDRLLPVRPLPE
jgi:Flp pilus assembly protein TadD